MKKVLYYTKSIVLGSLLQLESIWSLIILINNQNTVTMDLISPIQTIAVVVIVVFVAYKLRQLENRSSLFEAVFLSSVFKVSPTATHKKDLADALMLNSLNEAKGEIENMLLNVNPKLSKSEAEAIVGQFMDKSIARLESVKPIDHNSAELLRH